MAGAVLRGLGWVAGKSWNLLYGVGKDTLGTTTGRVVTAGTAAFYGYEAYAGALTEEQTKTKTLADLIVGAAAQDIMDENPAFDEGKVNIAVQQLMLRHTDNYKTRANQDLFRSPQMALSVQTLISKPFEEGTGFTEAEVQSAYEAAVNLYNAKPAAVVTPPAPSSSPPAPAPSTAVTSDLLTELTDKIAEAERQFEKAKAKIASAKTPMDAAQSAFDLADQNLTNAIVQRDVDEAAYDAINTAEEGREPSQQGKGLFRKFNASEAEAERLKEIKDGEGVSLDTAKRAYEAEVEAQETIAQDIKKMKLDRAHQAITLHAAGAGVDANTLIALNALLAAHTSGEDNPPVIDFADPKVLAAAKDLARKVDASSNISAADITTALTNLTGSAPVAPAEESTPDKPAADQTSPADGGFWTWNTAAGAWDWTKDTASGAMESGASVMGSAAQSAREMGATLELPGTLGNVGGSIGNFVTGAGQLAAGTLSRVWENADGSPNKEGRGWLAFIGIFAGSAVAAKIANDYMSKIPFLGSLPWGVGVMGVLLYAGYSALSSKPSQAGATTAFNDASGAAQQPTVTTTFTNTDGTVIKVDDLNRNGNFSVQSLQRNGATFADFKLITTDSVSTDMLKDADNVIHVPASRWGEKGRPKFESTRVDVAGHTTDAANDPEYNRKPVYLQATGTDGARVVLVVDNDDNPKNDASPASAPETPGR